MSHCQSLQSQELTLETSSLCQLVLRLTGPCGHQPHNNTALQTAVTLNHIITQCKEICLTHWKEGTESRFDHRSLNRDDELSEYLLTVRDRQQSQILSSYRLSDHTPAIQQGRLKTSSAERKQDMWSLLDR